LKNGHNSESPGDAEQRVVKSGMGLKEFRSLVERSRLKHPVWFQLETERPAKSEDITAIKSALGLQLPWAYKHFAAEYGGGYFAFATVYAIDPDSDWNILRRNVGSPVPSFLAFSDNGCGDLSGFRIDEGRCSDEVFTWDHETSSVSPIPRSENMFSFLAEVALKSHE
jgi:hypothetical protein